AAMRLRACDESTGAIRDTRVVDVWKTGVRPVFSVRLENGYQIRMTKEHRCLTDGGWMTLEEATGLRLREDGGVSWRADAPAFAVNGVSPHRSRDWLAAQRARGLAGRQIAAGAGGLHPHTREALRES